MGFAIKYCFVVFCIFTIYVSTYAQIRVLNGTELHIYGNTLIDFSQSSGNFEIDSNTVVTNNGIIDLGKFSNLIEKPGFPIYGTGYERANYIDSLGYVIINPGNLGLNFKTGSAAGNIVLKRYHSPDTNQLNFISINRKFLLTYSNLESELTEITLQFDTTELNNLDRKNIFVHVLDDSLITWSNYGESNNYPSFSCYTSTIGDSIKRITLFPFVSNLFDLNNNQFCTNDTIIGSIVISGIYNLSTVFMVKLSDQFGDFFTPAFCDTFSIVNDTINFSIPLNSISNSGSGYRISLSLVNPNISNLIFDTSITINSIIPPVISNVSNMLYCNPNYMSYQWYFAGNPLMGATADSLLASVEGEYIINVTDSNGCGILADTINLLFLEASSMYKPNGEIMFVPNPNDGVFVLQNNSNNIIDRIDVYDNQYKLILSYNNLNITSHNRMRFDFGIPSGIYFITLSSISTTKTQKLIIR